MVTETFNAKIYIAGCINTAKLSVQKWCDAQGDCWNVVETTYVYSNGLEDGVAIERINYPKFPASKNEIRSRARKLGEILRNDLNQSSYSIVFFRYYRMVLKMKYWISLSGGVASAISAILAYENNLDFEMVFADTLIEDHDLYRFIFELSLKLNKPIKWLIDGRNPWEVFVDRKFIGNSRTAHCSQILKTDIVRKYLKQYADENDVMVLGMDFSEIDRIERAQRNWQNEIQVISLLNDYKCYRPTWDAMLEKYNITKPSLYSYGFPHNNCGGYCCRSGLKQHATLLTYFPERYAYHEHQQNLAIVKIGPTARPSLKRTVKGVKEYLTLTRFRQLYEKGEITIPPYDWGGCACFIDEVDEK